MRVVDGTVIDVENAAVSYPALQKLTEATLTLSEGGTAQLDAVRDLDGTSLYVNDGVTLSLPSVTHYDGSSTGNSQYRRFQVTGENSRLLLNNLTYVVNGSHYNSRIYLEALAGGKLEASGLVHIEDTNVGDSNYRSVHLTADGENSSIDVSSLESITDRNATVSNGNGRWSTLSASNGGMLLTDELREVTGVHLTVGTGASFPNLENLTSGRLDVAGEEPVDLSTLKSLAATQVVVDTATADLSNLTHLSRTAFTLQNGGEADLSHLTHVDGSSFYVNDGVTLALPNVTHYDGASTDNSQHRYFRANGTGSKLLLPGLVNVTTGTHYNSRIYVQAQAGGQVDFSSVVQLADAVDGNSNHRAIHVSADGSESLVDLRALEIMTDRNGTAASGNGRYSTLQALNDGTVLTGPLREIQGVHVYVDGDRRSSDQ